MAIYEHLLSSPSTPWKRLEWINHLEERLVEWGEFFPQSTVIQEIINAERQSALKIFSPLPKGQAITSLSIPTSENLTACPHLSQPDASAPVSTKGSAGASAPVSTEGASTKSQPDASASAPASIEGLLNASAPASASMSQRDISTSPEQPSPSLQSSPGQPSPSLQSLYPPWSASSWPTPRPGPPLCSDSATATGSS
ncbi:hypothetical protein CRENBAI_019032 [Crenichthys baileyi]|uniref:Uncharacterized protein n=1 Tax=Crenichthys baileyi TaxID=28760 RepID=A0AAV9RXA9_9TELE